MLFWPLSSDAKACRKAQYRHHETGSLTSTVVTNAGRPWTIRTPANEDATFVSVEQEPSKSLRDIARVSPKYFWTIILYG
jgi:wyosine [tRNA(Phe)-imidazoG37] synthetase (radical SAM superfamily)